LKVNRKPFLLIKQTDLNKTLHDNAQQPMPPLLAFPINSGSSSSSHTHDQSLVSTKRHALEAQIFALKQENKNLSDKAGEIDKRANTFPQDVIPPLSGPDAPNHVKMDSIEEMEKRIGADKLLLEFPNYKQLMK